MDSHRALQRAFQTRYLADPSRTLAVALLTLSQNWLHHHILGEDMKYKGYGKG